MDTMKRTFAALLLASAVVGVATPAMADGPGDWNWSWKSNVQSQNGLLDLANNGNACASLIGVLAPGATCANS